ncbi:MAG: hypothetical protein ACRELD_12170 [Longimicrobiales bacterium]
MRTLAALAALALCVPSGATAQAVAGTIAPDTVTVGDVFRAGVAVALSDSGRVGFPDSLRLAGELEAAGERTIRLDSTASGRQLTAVYPLTAWRPGEHTLPAVALRVVDGTVDTTLLVTLPPVTVLSVLPADTAGIQPQPPKGIVGGYGWPWRWILGLAAALLLLALLAWLIYRWWTGRRREPVVTPLTARERALRALDRVREAGLMERGELKVFYSRVVTIVREYVAVLHPALGPEMTTLELGRVFPGPFEPANAEALLVLLTAADRVKFAGRRPAREDVEREWRGFREWVEAVPPSPAPREEEVAA